MAINTDGYLANNLRLQKIATLTLIFGLALIGVACGSGTGSQNEIEASGEKNVSEKNNSSVPLESSNESPDASTSIPLESSNESPDASTFNSDDEVYYRAPDDWRACNDLAFPDELPQAEQDYSATWFTLEGEEIASLPAAQQRFQDSGDVTSPEPLSYFLYTDDGFVINFNTVGAESTYVIWRVCVNPVADT